MTRYGFSHCVGCDALIDDEMASRENRVGFCEACGGKQAVPAAPVNPVAIFDTDHYDDVVSGVHRE